MYLNKVTLIGNLTRDPEFKALPSGMQVVSFSLATNRSWKGKDGQKQEAVEYHNVVAFGRTAEVINQYVKKGHQILIEGRLQTRTWDDKESGKKQYRTEIITDNFQFGNKPAGTTTAPARDEQVDQSVSAPAPESIDYPDEEINPDDIPF